MYIAIMILVSMMGAVVLSIATYLGGFKSVEFAIEDRPELILLYAEHTGAYHKIVPQLEEIEAWAKANNISCSKTFGRFLDNPETTEEIRLRSETGCLIDNADALAAIAEVPYKVQKLPPHEVLRGRFDGAPGLGPLKVYPKAKDWFLENSFEMETEVIEFYTLQPDGGVVTEYDFPIAAKGHQHPR